MGGVPAGIGVLPEVLGGGHGGVTVSFQEVRSGDERTETEEQQGQQAHGQTLKTRPTEGRKNLLESAQVRRKMPTHPYAKASPISGVHRRVAASAVHPSRRTDPRRSQPRCLAFVLRQRSRRQQWRLRQTEVKGPSRVLPDRFRPDEIPGEARHPGGPRCSPRRQRDTRPYHRLVRCSGMGRRPRVQLRPHSWCQFLPLGQDRCDPLGRGWP